MENRSLVYEKPYVIQASNPLLFHQKGFAVRGQFELYPEMEKTLLSYSHCALFSSINKKIPVYARFSSYLGGTERPDTIRNIRGMALRFYTGEGSFDLFTHNVPVFCLIPQDQMWETISSNPENLHWLFWYLSDRALPRSYSAMEGFSIHHYMLKNVLGKISWAKFVLRPMKGLYSLLNEEAQFLAGYEPEFYKKEFQELMARKRFPEWELCLQIFEAKDMEKYSINLNDVTSFVPEEFVPLKKIGRIHFHQMTEDDDHTEMGLNPKNTIPGLDLFHNQVAEAQIETMERHYSTVMEQKLDGRLCSPWASVKNNNFSRPQGDSIKDGFTDQKFTSLDPFHGARLYYNSLTEAEQEHLLEAAFLELSRISNPDIVSHLLDDFSSINSDLVSELATRLAYPLPSPKKIKETKPPYSRLLSMQKYPSYGINGLRVAILVEEGFSYEDYMMIKQSFETEGALCQPLSHRLGMLKSDSEEEIQVSHSYFNTREVFFDAVFVPGGMKSVDALLKDSLAIKFLEAAILHRKTIAAFIDGISILDSCAYAPSLEEMEGIYLAHDSSEKKMVLEQFHAGLELHRHYERIMH